MSSSNSRTSGSWWEVEVSLTICSKAEVGTLWRVNSQEEIKDKGLL